jgi:Fuc2NAc and GlcNAc transferase
MTELSLALFLSCIFIFSVLLTGIIRQYSLRNLLIDIPNERSSHSQPTPRGGGLSITLSVLMSTELLYCLQITSLDLTIALGGGGLLVAIVGWLDDHRDISAIWRAISYTTAAIWAVYWLDGLNSITLGEYVMSLPVSGSLFAVLGLAWLTNLYNFMDGTDALAAVQAICAGIFSGIMFLSSGRQDLAILCFVISTASSGFLYWNWPPAKIFMGDVGSCLIGFSFGLLAIIGEKSDTLPVLVWFILLSVFICDSTLTLLMRILKGEKWYSAHRLHAYQRLVQMGVSHNNLAMGVLGINVMILWPTAYIAYRWEKLSCVVASIVLLLMCIVWGVIQLRYNRLSISVN